MTTSSLYHLREVRLMRGTGFTLTIDDWQHPHGEPLCLVGPTGAGKTTLLRVLTGLQPLESGRLDFDGHAWPNGLDPFADVRQITLVPQRPILLSRSVRANLEYGLHLRGIEANEKVDAMLNRLGLMKLAAQNAHTLSGGQIQLVALGRTLVLEPKVLLLDEPKANLDPGYVELVEQVLAECRRQQQTTLIWATHNLFQAQRVADWVGLMLGGRMIEIAAQDEFFHHPCDSRTADFVQGRMVYWCHDLRSPYCGSVCC